MKQKVYAIYDTDMEIFSEPYIAPDDDSVKDALEHQMQKYELARQWAKHTMIQQIAEYDATSGKYTNLETPRTVIDSNQSLKMALEAEREAEKDEDSTTV